MLQALRPSVLLKDMIINSTITHALKYANEPKLLIVTFTNC